MSVISYNLGQEHTTGVGRGGIRNIWKKAYHLGSCRPRRIFLVDKRDTGYDGSCLLDTHLGLYFYTHIVCFFLSIAWKNPRNRHMQKCHNVYRLNYHGILCMAHRSVCDLMVYSDCYDDGCLYLCYQPFFFIHKKELSKQIKLLTWTKKIKR